MMKKTNGITLHQLIFPNYSRPAHRQATMPLPEQKKAMYILAQLTALYFLNEEMGFPTRLTRQAVTKPLAKQMGFRQM